LGFQAANPVWLTIKSGACVTRNGENRLEKRVHLPPVHSASPDRYPISAIVEGFRYAYRSPPAKFKKCRKKCEEAEKKWLTWLINLPGRFCPHSPIISAG
jgi:hypothetical protein